MRSEEVRVDDNFSSGVQIAATELFALAITMISGVHHMEEHAVHSSELTSRAQRR